MAAAHRSVQVDDCHIDAACALLVRDPARFDVIVTENMFGDILFDLTAELAGSLGSEPVLNCLEARAMAQATHGSASDLAGRDTANPIGMVLSTAMLLDWIGHRRDQPSVLEATSRLTRAVTDVLNAGTRLADLGGTTSTTRFGDLVVEVIERS